MKNTQSSLIMWTLVVLYAIFQVIMGINENELIHRIMPIAVTLVSSAFIIFHASARYGIKRVAVFFLITFLVSWSYENISVVSGFPFGNYHYSDKLGIKLLYVPIIIMPAYFGTGYLSWTIAQILLNKYKNDGSFSDMFFVPFLASFVMVMWDLMMDPYMSTIRGNWVWENGGAYFGVPFVNFMGWFLCVFTIYVLFSFYIKKRELPDNKLVTEKNYWLQAVLMYALLPVFLIIKSLFADNLLVESPEGHVWWTGDIYKAGVLVSVFTMYFVSVLAIKKIWNRSE